MANSEIMIPDLLKLTFLIVGAILGFGLNVCRDFLIEKRSRKSSKEILVNKLYLLESAISCEICIKQAGGIKYLAQFEDYINLDLLIELTKVDQQLDSPSRRIKHRVKVSPISSFISLIQQTQMENGIISYGSFVKLPEKIDNVISYIK